MDEVPTAIQPAPEFFAGGGSTRRHCIALTQSRVLRAPHQAEQLPKLLLDPEVRQAPALVGLTKLREQGRDRLVVRRETFEEMHAASTRPRWIVELPLC